MAVDQALTLERPDPIEEGIRLAADAAGGVKPHVEYQGRTLDWIVEKLGVGRRSLVWSENDGYEDHVWDGTPDPFVVACECVDRWQSVGIESGTGTGKTAWLAFLTMSLAARYEDSLALTAAPKGDQVLDKVWKEIERWWPRFQAMFPQARLMDSGEIRMRPGASRTWRAFAQITGVRAGERSATKAQGDHADVMVIMTEETPGIAPAVMMAYDQTLVGTKNIQVSVGNPDHVEDELHRFCVRPDVEHIRISALDHPNVVTGDDALVPGAVSRASIERRKAQYEHVPALYQSRVRGISPAQAVGVALAYDPARHRRAWPLSAVQFALQVKRWPLYLGLDFGYWRFAAVWVTVDMAGGVHVVQELFSQCERIGERARVLADTWSSFGSPDRVLAWGDPAGAQDRHELNQALKKLGVSWRVMQAPRGPPDSVGRDQGQRVGMVTRLNQLLGRGMMTFARELDRGPGWRRGRNAASEGTPMTGSRLVWEIRNWRYPDPREGQAQPQDPDDNSADGADAIAALRYLVAGYLKAAPAPEAHHRPNRNVDTRLEQLAERRQQRTARSMVRTA
ncbi:hypothetical protein [Candidatus Palauibacter sp.]|uniref:hypothetical protein n=1 Tax=Candidatus Palauibacter sp. TaxID=3101350 RepID=UPI003CC6961D